MIYLIDGSNLLGRLRRDHESVAEKRELVRAVATALRERKARGQLFFDGAAPDGFATELGHLSIRFSGAGSADDLIVRATEKQTACCVVTSDQGLRGRVATRRIKVLSADDFGRLLGKSGTEQAGGGVVDWETYFSDEKNRII